MALGELVQSFADSPSGDPDDDGLSDADLWDRHYKLWRSRGFAPADADERATNVVEHRRLAAERTTHIRLGESTLAGRAERTTPAPSGVREGIAPEITASARKAYSDTEAEEHRLLSHPFRPKQHGAGRSFGADFDESRAAAPAASTAVETDYDRDTRAAAEVEETGRQHARETRGHYSVEEMRLGADRAGSLERQARDQGDVLKASQYKLDRENLTKAALALERGDTPETIAKAFSGLGVLSTLLGDENAPEVGAHARAREVLEGALDTEGMHERGVTGFAGTTISDTRPHLGLKAPTREVLEKDVLSPLAGALAGSMVGGAASSTIAKIGARAALMAGSGEAANLITRTERLVNPIYPSGWKGRMARGAIEGQVPFVSEEAAVAHEQERDPFMAAGTAAAANVPFGIATELGLGAIGATARAGGRAWDRHLESIQQRNFERFPERYDWHGDHIFTEADAARDAHDPAVKQQMYERLAGLLSDKKEATPIQTAINPEDITVSEAAQTRRAAENPSLPSARDISDRVRPAMVAGAATGLANDDEKRDDLLHNLVAVVVGGGALGALIEARERGVRGPDLPWPKFVRERIDHFNDPRAAYEDLADALATMHATKPATVWGKMSPEERKALVREAGFHETTAEDAAGKIYPTPATESEDHPWYVNRAVRERLKPMLWDRTDAPEGVAMTDRATAIKDWSREGLGRMAALGAVTAGSESDDEDTRNAALAATAIFVPPRLRAKMVEVLKKAKESGAAAYRSTSEWLDLLDSGDALGGNDKIRSVITTDLISQLGPGEGHRSVDEALRAVEGLERHATDPALPPFYSRLKRFLASTPDEKGKGGLGKRWDEPRPAQEWMDLLRRGGPFRKEEAALLLPELAKAKADGRKLTRADILAVAEEKLPKVEQVTLEPGESRNRRDVEQEFEGEGEPEGRADAVVPLTQIGLTPADVMTQLRHRRALNENLLQRLNLLENSTDVNELADILSEYADRPSLLRAQVRARERRIEDIESEINDAQNSQADEEYNTVSHVLRNYGMRDRVRAQALEALTEGHTVQHVIEHHVYGEIDINPPDIDFDPKELLSENGYEIEERPGDWVFHSHADQIDALDPHNNALPAVRELGRVPHEYEAAVGQTDREGNEITETREHTPETALAAFRREHGDVPVAGSSRDNDEFVIYDRHGVEQARGDDENELINEFIRDNELDQELRDNAYTEAETEVIDSIRSAMDDYWEAREREQEIDPDLETEKDRLTEEIATINDAIEAAGDREEPPDDREQLRQLLGRTQNQIAELRDRLHGLRDRLRLAGKTGPLVRGQTHYEGTQMIGGGKNYREILSVWGNPVGESDPADHMASYGYTDVIGWVRGEEHEVYDMPDVNGETVERLPDDSPKVANQKDQLIEARKTRDELVGRMRDIEAELQQLPTSIDHMTAEQRNRANVLADEWRTINEKVKLVGRNIDGITGRIAIERGVDRGRVIHLLGENQSDVAQHAAASGVRPPVDTQALEAARRAVEETKQRFNAAREAYLNNSDVDVEKALEAAYDQADTAREAARRELAALENVGDRGVDPHPFVIGGFEYDPKNKRWDASGELGYRLNAMAGLADAVARNADWYGWSDARNRHDLAHFRWKAAANIYGQKAEKGRVEGLIASAFREVFDALGFKDMKFEHQYIKGYGHWVFKLTPEMRETIKKIGLPLMSAVAVASMPSTAEAAEPGDQTEGAADRSALLAGGAVAVAGVTLARAAYRHGIAAALKDVMSRGVATNPVVLGALGYAMSNVPDDEFQQFGNATIALAALKAIGTGRMRKAGGAVGKEIIDAARSWGAEGVVRAFNPDALLSPEVRSAIRTFEQTRAKGVARAKEYGQKLSAKGPVVNRAVTDAMRGESWEPNVSPADQTAALSLALDLANQMGEVGREKVAHDIITPEQFNASGGDTYLPRVYAEHEAQAANPAIEGPGGGGRRTRITQQHSRMDLSDKLRQELGEVRESSYLASYGLERGWSDVGAAALFETLDATPGVLHPGWSSARQDFEIAKLMNDQAAMDVAKQQMADVSREFKTRQGDYVALPETEGLGKLSGAVVQRDVANSINGVPDLGAVQTIFSWWKQAKTVFNPGTHIANTVSNAVMLHMAGLSMAEQPKWLTRAVDDLGSYGPVTRDLTEHGIMNSIPMDTRPEGVTRGRYGPTYGDLLTLRDNTTPYTAAVLEERGIKSRGEKLADAGHPTAGSLVDRLSDLGRAVDEKIGAGKFSDEAHKLYANEDNVFRVAAYLWQQSLGKTDAEAREFALKELIDFRTRSPAMHLARNSVFPFLIYPAKAIPKFAANIIDHPERWIILSGTLLALNEYGEQESGYDFGRGDIPEKDRTLGLGPMFPELIQLPLARAKTGGVPALDFTRWTPGSGVTQGAPEHTPVAKLGLPAVVNPSGPIVDLASALATGRDPYRDEPITAEHGVPAGIDYAKYGLREFLPTAASIHGPRFVGDVRKDNPEKVATDAWSFLGARPRYFAPGTGARAARREYRDYRTRTLDDLEQDVRDSQNPAYTQQRVREVKGKLLRAASRRVKSSQALP